MFGGMSMGVSDIGSITTPSSESIGSSSELNNADNVPSIIIKFVLPKRLKCSIQPFF